MSPHESVRTCPPVAEGPAKNERHPSERSTVTSKADPGFGNGKETSSKRKHQTTGLSCVEHPQVQE